MKKLESRKQVFHYILSFSDEVLISWYNSEICSGWDFPLQTIRELIEEGEDLKKGLDLEEIIEIARNTNSVVDHDDLYIALTGGENPYFVTFDTFEQFIERMSKDDKQGFLDYLLENREKVEALELTDLSK